VIATLGQPKTVEPKTAEDCKISAKPAVIPFPGVGHCGKQVWTPGLRNEKNDCSVRQAHVEVVKQAIITIGSSIRFNPRRLTAPVPILDLLGIVYAEIVFPLLDQPTPLIF